MPPDQSSSRFLSVSAAFVLLAVGLSACAGDGPVKTIAEVAGMATTAQESKAFVQATRPSDPAYLPVNTTIPVNPLCAGPNPPPPFVATGPNARFGAGSPAPKPTDPCKTRAEFKKIEAELDARRISNDAAGTQAQALGKALPPPAPAKVLPTN